MKLVLHPYGPLIEVLGAPPVRVDAPVATAGELLNWLHGQNPSLANWKNRIACAQGENLLHASSPLDASVDVALIPPVSGG